MDPDTLKKIYRLRQLLIALPHTLPIPEISTYCFTSFAPDADWIEDTGSTAGGVNRQLEVHLGSRVKDFKLKERGPETIALADVLEHWIGICPDDVLLLKWLEDVTIAAENAYMEAGEEVRVLKLHVSEFNLTCVACAEQIPNTEIEQPASVTEEPPTVAPIKQSTTKPKGKKAQSHILLSFADPRYQTDEESEDERSGGVKLLPLLKKTSKPYLDSDGKKRARCIASSHCNKTWAWPRSRQRLLDHAAHECKALPQEWRSEALEYLSEKGANGRAKKSRPVEEDVKSDVEEVPSRKKSKMDVSGSSSSVSKQTTLGSSFAEKGAQTLKKDAHRKLMLFVTCTGIPPRVIDSPEFNAFCGVLNSKYTPPCSTTITETLVPDEAAAINMDIVGFLRTQRDLTLSWDGGKTRRQKSFYSIHVITALRQCFLLDLDDASMLSHTADYIVEQVMGVVLKIGAERFSGASSDDTGNTRSSRRKLATKLPFILNLQDACHLLSLCLTQIGKLPEFAIIIRKIKKILKLMYNSTYTMEHFNYQRTQLNISRGLEKPGKTRFAGVFWAGVSIQRCLPAFSAIIDDDDLEIDISGMNNLFESRSSAALLFQADLAKLAAVFGPYARAIQCLESPHTTCSDVYLYWLAIVSQISHLLKGNTVELEDETKARIREITNM
ncbi:hypothetical protein HWV62_4273 [Athelia sp. TMB]|nr:hypothetical protein HWV62_14958 [Athelia sp. TMB]KAF7977299.1 hypothetical protein HWV62_4273 [Athelia sp. TMB]